MVNLVIIKRHIALHHKTTDMKNIVLICLLLAFTACNGHQIRSFCNTAGKKIAACCTSMSLKQRHALKEGRMDVEKNKAEEKLTQQPAAISLLEWNEAVFIW